MRFTFNAITTDIVAVPIRDARLRLDDDRSVAIDPKVAFGRLVIARIGIPILAVAQRYIDGKSIDELAEEYAVNA